LIGQSAQTNTVGSDQGSVLESIQEVPADDILVELSEQPEPDAVMENPVASHTEKTPNEVTTILESSLSFVYNLNFCSLFRMLMIHWLRLKMYLGITLNQQLVINLNHRLLKFMNQNQLKTQLFKHKRHLLLQR
jgi:hypothetical protein